MGSDYSTFVSKPSTPPNRNNTNNNNRGTTNNSTKSIKDTLQAAYGDITDTKEFEELLFRHNKPEGLWEWLEEEYLSRIDKNNILKIKMVIVDIDYWKDRPVLAWFVTKLIAPPDGLVHTALQIGPFVLHWFNSSLVHILGIGSEKGLVCTDIGTLNYTTDRDKLDQVIEWNTTKEYNARKCNCQTFVEDVLSTIGMPKQFDGALGAFLKRLKERGIYDKIYIDERGKEIFFNDHKILDQYCAANKHLEKQRPTDWALLKSFDRAFWMGHLNIPQDYR